jgi:hypothetical protein
MNVVMVKKKNGKWRMWMDFTDLNKCCPKDDFPLSRIDNMVDSTTGCKNNGVARLFLRVQLDMALHGR